MQHVALNRVGVVVSILRVLTLLLNRPRGDIDVEKGICFFFENYHSVFRNFGDAGEC